MKAPLTLLMRALGDALPAALLAVVLVVVGADVFARTVLHRPFQMAHELAIVAFAGVVWFGIVGTALSAEMFGVRFFVERLPRRLRVPAEALAHLAVIAIAGAVLRAAVAQVQTSRFTTFLALGWPKWIVSAGLAVAMIAVIVIQLMRLRDLLRDARE